LRKAHIPPPGSVAEQRERQLGDRLAGLAQREAVGAPEALEGFEAGEHVQRRGRSRLAEPWAKPARAGQAPGQGLEAGALVRALTAADDRTLVDAMQQMIDRIENPAFFLAFLGAPALATVALVQAHGSGQAKIAGWIVAALALYTVMVVITFAVHIPLNDDLKQAGDPARIENPAAVRDDFVTPWVAWDIVRTLATTAAFASLTWALVLRARIGGERIDARV
jgi:uncharacterized membrane protein